MSLSTAPTPVVSARPAGPWLIRASSMLSVMLIDVAVVGAEAGHRPQRVARVVIEADPGQPQEALLHRDPAGLRVQLLGVADAHDRLVHAAGDGVEPGDLPDPGLGLLASGDVGQHGEGADHAAVVVAHRAGGDDRPQLGAVAAVEADVVLLGGAADRRRQHTLRLRPGRRIEEVDDGGPGELVQPAPQQLGQAAIGEEGAAGGVEQPDALVGGVGDPAVVRLAPPEGLGGRLVTDGDGGQVRGRVHPGDLGGQGTARLAVVHGEGAQHLVRRGEDGARPAGAQPVRQGQVLVRRPVRMSRDVLDDDALAQVGGGAAGPLGGPDGCPVDGAAEFGGQAGGGTVADAALLAVEEQDRAAHPGRLPLDQPDDALEHVGEGSAVGNPLQDVPLAGVKGPGLDARARHRSILGQAAPRMQAPPP